MTTFARNKRIGYAIYLALIFLIVVTLPGFHDNSFTTSLILYLTASLIFSVWILRSNNFIRIFVGLLIALLSVIFSYYIQSLFFSLLSDAIMAAVLFIGIYAVVFICLWELTLFLFAKLRRKALK
jgi:hypothetical protein